MQVNSPEAPIKYNKDVLYETLLQINKDQGIPEAQKKIEEYTQFISDSAHKLFKAMQKQGHTPSSAYYTLVQLVEAYYLSVGVVNPKVYLPKPGEKENEQ